MAQPRLDYVMCYRGNLVTGFHRYYAKRFEGIAFQCTTGPAETPYEITSPAFVCQRQGATVVAPDSSRPFYNITADWDDFVTAIIGYLNHWMFDYRGPAYSDPSQNDEWGVRFRIAGYTEQTIWGLNAYPDDLDNFIQTMTSKAKTT